MTPGQRYGLPRSLLARLVRHVDEEGNVRPGIRGLHTAGRAERRGKTVAHRDDGSPLTRPSLGTRKRARRRGNEIARASRRRNR